MTERSHEWQKDQGIKCGLNYEHVETNMLLEHLSTDGMFKKKMGLHVQGKEQTGGADVGLVVMTFSCTCVES